MSQSPHETAQESYRNALRDVNELYATLCIMQQMSGDSRVVEELQQRVAQQERLVEKFRKQLSKFDQPYGPYVPMSARLRTKDK